MALTATQVNKALKLLGLPLRIDQAAGYTGGDGPLMRRASIARKLLEGVDAGQEAEVAEILTQYAEVEFDATSLQAEGLSQSAAKTRALLRGQLAMVIGYTLGQGGGGIQIRRA